MVRRFSTEGLARAAARHPWRVLGAWIVSAVRGNDRLAVHAWIAFGRRPPSEREIELEVARLQDAG